MFHSKVKNPVTHKIHIFITSTLKFLVFNILMITYMIQNDI